MVIVSGVAPVISAPVFSSGGSQRDECDFLVEASRKNELQIVAGKSKELYEVIEKLKVGDTIFFEGLLASEEPGMYFVNLKKIRKVPQNNTGKSLNKHRTKLNEVENEN